MKQVLRWVLFCISFFVCVVGGTVIAGQLLSKIATTMWINIMLLGLFIQPFLLSLLIIGILILIIFSFLDKLGVLPVTISVMLKDIQMWLARWVDQVRYDFYRWKS